MVQPSLWAPLSAARPGEPLLRTWAGERFVPLTWDDWMRAAEATAWSLRQRGVEAGERVGVMFDNSREAAALVLGAWLAGGTVVSLPGPSRAQTAEAYRSFLETVAGENAISTCLVPAAAAALDGLVEGVAFVPHAEVCDFGAPGGRVEWQLPGADDVVFVQYSSGSTADPRGCELTAAAIAAQLAMLAETLEVDPEADQGVSWLPLSHDMGMFGCLLLTYWTGHPLLLSTPERFLRDPWSLGRDASQVSATLGALPAFGLSLLARASVNGEAVDLGFRHLVLGGDRVPASLLRGARAQLARHGMSETAFKPAYGLAEATLAVTMTSSLEPGPAPTLRLDALAAQTGRATEADPQDPRAIELVSNGPPLPGVELHLPAGDLSELHVRSPSLARGYVGDRQGERWTELGFRTGDRALVRAGQLYVDGRIDDVLIVGARNVSAFPAEDRLGEHEQTRKGNVVLVQPGEQQGAVHALVEWKGSLERSALRSWTRDASRIVRESIGVPLAEVAFVEPGSLPKTPSGKVQRHRCRRLLEERTAVRATVSVADA